MRQLSEAEAWRLIAKRADRHDASKLFDTRAKALGVSSETWGAMYDRVISLMDGTFAYQARDAESLQALVIAALWMELEAEAEAK